MQYLSAITVPLYSSRAFSKCSMWTSPSFVPFVPKFDRFGSILHKNGMFCLLPFWFSLVADASTSTDHKTHDLQAPSVPLST